MLYLIDGSSQMYRAYHAPVRTADGGLLRNAQGTPTNAVYIFVTMLRKLLNEHKPEHIAASFDLPGRTFRDDLASDLVAIHDEDPDALSIEEIASILFSLSFAGHETSNNLIANCITRAFGDNSPSRLTCGFSSAAR